MRMATITVSSGNLSSDITIQQGFGIEINGLIWAKSDVAQPGYLQHLPTPKDYCINMTQLSAIPTPVRKKTIINLMVSEREHTTTEFQAGELKRILVRKAGEFPNMKKYKD